jgi:protein-disulfide isomerase
MNTHLQTPVQRLFLFLTLCLLFDSTVAAQQSTKVPETTSKNSSSQAGSESSAKPERRIITIIGDTKLDVRQWALIGKLDAKYVFVEMFDYTCPHCRDLHHEIDAVLKKYGDDLAVITLPVPLNRTCNSQVGTIEAQHRDACAIANYAIAVWRLEPKKYHEYHNWLFKPTHARTAADARKHAIGIVGDARLSEILDKRLPQKFIASHVKLYSKAGAGSIPKILFPNITLVGNVGSDKLTEAIERQLGNP